MKLVRYGAKGEERPGLIDADGRIRDLSDHIADLAGAALDPERLRDLGDLDPATLPLVRGQPRLGAPVANVGNILGIGLNYRDHAAETGAAPPAEPLVFSKAVTALNGPDDPLIIPKNSRQTDWEAELAVIIGRKAQYIDEAASLAHIAGYAIMNDVSEREFQKDRGGQFVKGKSADSFAPLGPWLVTTDEIADPQNLDIWLDLNGEPRQRGNTRDMIFGVAMLVSYLSQFMTLMPGDVITTGTPAGVGAGCKPPRFLKPGDVVELGVAGLGRQRQHVVAYQSA